MCQGQISFQKTYEWATETRDLKSNSSELLRLSWLPATLIDDLIKNEWAVNEWMETQFSHYKSMGKFLDAQEQLTP